jgi:hypothetical protein
MMGLRRLAGYGPTLRTAPGIRTFADEPAEKLAEMRLVGHST